MSAAQDTGSLTPLEIAEAAAKASTALLEDAEASAARASVALDQAREALAKAKSDEAAALERSAAARDDADLTDEAARAQIRRMHAERDVASAERGHGQAQAELAGRREHLVDVGRAVTVQAILVQLGDGTLERELGEHGRALVDGFLSMHTHLVAIDELLAEDRARVARAHAAGAPPSLRASDGLPAAVAVMRALHEQGAGCVRSPHWYRWPFEHNVKSSSERWPRVYALVRHAVDSMELVRRGKTTGTSHQELGRHVERWTGYRTLGEAEGAGKVVDQAAADAEAARVRGAHEARLHTLAGRRKALQGLPQRLDGSPLGPCYVCGHPVGVDAQVERIGEKVLISHPRGRCAPYGSIPPNERAPDVPPGRPLGPRIVRPSGFGGGEEYTIGEAADQVPTVG